LEGKDLYFLKRFHNLLFPRSKIALDAVPNTSVGGWGGWNYAVGSSMFLRNSVGEEVITYCVLDADYHTEEEIRERLEDASTKGVELHVWKRKEVENYLFVPAAILRAAQRLEPRLGGIRKEDIVERIDRVADELQTDIIELMAEHSHQRDRRTGIRTHMQRARDSVRRQWASFEGRISLLPGKRALGRLSELMRDELGVSLSPGAVASAMREAEIADEVRGVLEAIERGRRFGQ
jgi:hypothetical protein